MAFYGFHLELKFNTLQYLIRIAVEAVLHSSEYANQSEVSARSGAGQYGGDRTALFGSGGHYRSKSMPVLL